MKKMLKDFGGIILFYSVIILGVLLLNIRFSYLNKLDQNGKYIAMSVENNK